MKSNFIGDAIIPERDSEDEDEENKKSQRMQQKEQEQSAKPSYMNRYSKINKLFSEATSEYKQ